MTQATISNNQSNSLVCVTIKSRKKIHVLLNENTLCGIAATAEGILHTFDGGFTAEDKAVCKSCYQLGLEIIN